MLAMMPFQNKLFGIYTNVCAFITKDKALSCCLRLQFSASVAFVLPELFAEKLLLYLLANKRCYN